MGEDRIQCSVCTNTATVLRLEMAALSLSLAAGQATWDVSVIPPVVKGW
jgi:hypothetical protein